MIDQITITNQTTDVSVDFYKTFGHAFLLETDGINWDAAPATHNTYTNLTGVGNIITSTKIGSRTISITGRVCSPHTIKEICTLYNVVTIDEVNEKRLEEIESAKKVLSALFNPESVLRITAGDFHIDGKPTSSVKYSNTWKENNEIYCKFTISLFCEYPLFKYKSMTEVPLSGISGGFHFPVVIPKPNGMHFGKIIPYQLIVVNNDSDISLGGVFTLKADEPITGPIVLTDVYNQKTMRLVKSLASGEIVKIDTTTRTIKGSVDGGLTFTSYLQYWDFDNDWIQFGVGGTVIGYSAEGYSYRYLKISIDIDKGFYSLEDQ